VRLGTLVAAATFRPPALLVKAVTTLDVLSDGRAWLGVGPATRRTKPPRWVCRCLPSPNGSSTWRTSSGSLGRCGPATGTVPRCPHQLAAPSCDRRRSPDPHPPILVGGTGEKWTLRLVAEHADACNLFDIPDGGKTVAHKLAVLARHCQEVGRPRAEIETTLSTRIGPGQSATDFVAHCTDMAGLGVDHAILLTAGPWTGRSVEDLADIVKVLADVPGAGS
jgi:alkanesulfonate monooxygenase SsuD/methylene tetrahydromethanopterin reductase-like flavin-dependent oxidoreductase (luciferase family)